MSNKSLVYKPPSKITNPNPLVNFDTSINGSVYALSAKGGYLMNQGVKTIKLLAYEQLQRYDVTNSVQINYDVRVFNDKLGLFKDASNIDIQFSDYDADNLTYPMSSINISSEEFVNQMKAVNIISVGSLSTLYSDFITFVDNYFSYPYGFSSLFTITSQFDINGGLFDENAFINIINGKSIDSNGAYVKDLSGSITIEKVNEILRFINYTNPFGNRDPSGNANTASDSTNRNNYTMADGFLENDLIYVPQGVVVSLSVNISNNGVNITGAGNTHSQLIDNDYVNGDFSQVTTVSSTNITRVVSLPLLIRLENRSQRQTILQGTVIKFTNIITVVVNNVIIDSSGNFSVATK